MTLTCIIRVLHDASLFCDKSCVLASFHMEGEEDSVLRQGDSAAWSLASEQLSSLGLKLSNGPSYEGEEIPGMVILMKEVAELLMKEMDLFCEPCTVLQERDQNISRLVTVHRDQALTLHLIGKTLRFVQSVYAFRNSDAPSTILREVQGLLTHREGLAKSREIKELREAIEDLKLPWIPLDENHQLKDVLQLGFGRQQKVLEGTIAFASSHLGVQTTLSKMRSRYHLAQLGFPVPRQTEVSSEKDAIHKAKKMGFPVVLKADVGAFGSRVHSDLRSVEDLERAYALLLGNMRDVKMNKVFIEEQIPGEVFRLEVIDGVFFEAYHMIPAHVVGDGVRSIEELVELENQKPTRGRKQDRDVRFLLLKLREEELATLLKDGYTPRSIPEKGAKVLLSSNSNWSMGGTFKLVTEEVHPDNRKLVERITRSLDIGIVGIDLATPDISTSYLENSLKIIEVNHTPTLGPSNIGEGPSKSFGRRLIQQFAGEMAFGQVPVVIAKESQGSWESLQLLEQAFQHIGYSPGMVGSHGIRFCGEVWSNSEGVQRKNPSVQILRNPDLGAALIERKAVDMADHGLGSGGCDIALVLDLSVSIQPTSLYPKGISSSSIDFLLLREARKMSIVALRSRKDVEIWRSLDLNSCLLIAPADVLSELNDAEEDIPSLCWYESQNCEVRSNLKGISGEFLLKGDDGVAPLPSLFVLACLWALEVQPKEIFSCLQIRKSS